MSIDGIKSRGSRGRSIDGFSVSRQPIKRVVPSQQQVPHNVHIKKNTSSKTTQQTKPAISPAKNNASKTFLAPVESFDFDISSDEISEDELKKVGKKVKKKEKKKKNVFRKILIVVLIIVFLCGGAFLVWGNDIIYKITGGQSGVFDLPNLFQESYVDLKTDKNGRTNVLIFGTSGYDMEGTNGDYAHDGAQLTDTIMIVSFDQKSGDVAMVNLPRDLKVGGTCTATGKINEVYWCNNLEGDDEESGATALMEKVDEILDVEIQYYAHVNWNTLVTIVDTLGGITVTLDEDIDDSFYTGVVINAGEPTTLDGGKALGLARARHGTELGDFSRGNSQQKILIALKERILEKGVDILEALNIVNSLGDNVRTNISLNEIKAGMNILKTFDIESMRQIPLIDLEKDINYIAYTMENGVSYVIPSAGARNYLQIQDYVGKMLSSDPVVREGSTIEILNGTDESGVASNEQKKLEAEGFTIELIGDAPDGDYEGLSVYILNEEMTGTKAKLEEYYKTEVKPASEIPSEIASGCDFLIIIGEKKDAE